MSTRLQRIACLGGVYSNWLALESALADIATRSVDAIYCLGDLGGFGPHPDRVFPLIQDAGIHCLQGNYDDSIGHGLDDCQCGYTDPRDNRFAQISYQYTLARTSAHNRSFLRQLPKQHRLQLGRYRLLLCHGSPRRVNEFLWESASSTHFLDALCHEYHCDAIVATHTGIKWHRTLNPSRHFINVGALGRPENDGTPRVWYTLLEATADNLSVEFVPVEYDYQRLAAEMQAESLPPEFTETILTGWWTTCLEILPSRERQAGLW